MTITFRLDEIDGALLKAYAASIGLSVSDYIRNLIMTDIECSYGLLLESLE